MKSKHTDRVDLVELSQRLKKAQEYVRSVVPPGVSLADELIAERREEARREIEDQAK